MHVAGLFHYPVKSLRGVAVETLDLGARGPLHDREWMLVDPNGRFLSQRSTPLMATLTAGLTSDTLRLSDDGGATLEVPRENGGTSLDVTVWRDTVSSIDCGDAAAAWLQARLHQPCRLVRLPGSTIRPLDAKFSPQFGIKVRQRFVEQEHVHIAHQRPTDGDALALATRHRTGLTVQ